jgi:FkbM family methyltransferase
MKERLQFLKERFNFFPSIIYDIGSHEGVWTNDCRKIFPSSKYIQFEADTDKKKMNTNGDITFYELLGNEDNKEINYYKIKTQYTTGNSIFPENSHHYTDTNNFYIEKRIMKRIDTIVEENSLMLPDFMKLDTQGSELLILEGAPKCMKNVQIILLEISLHEYNKNAPLISDVLFFMKERGFVLFDIIDTHHINGVLAQIDALFCKEDSCFLLRKFT